MFFRVVSIPALALIVGLFAPASAVAQGASSWWLLRSGGTTANTAPAAKGPVVPIFTLGGAYPERNDPLDIFSVGSDTLHSMARRIRATASDDRVTTVVLKFEAPWLGLGQAGELRRAIEAASNAGKETVVFMDLGDPVSYVTASAADQIVMPSVGLLDLRGIRFGFYFFRDLLEKVGLQAQVVNTGRFKNAFEPFTHQEMSEGTREQMTELMEDLFTTWVEQVARGRELESAAARALLTGGPYTSGDALEKGAIDAVLYFDELMASIAEAAPDAEYDWEYGIKKDTEPVPSIMSLLSTAWSRPEPKGEGKAGDRHIAVVYALGPIVDGRAGPPNPLNPEQLIAGDDFLDLLDEVLQSESVVALVVRIDSPGGSAVASDQIAYRLRQIGVSLPVVVSMGDMAASGGYYIAAAADKIVAEPTTITGSIGVIGGRIVTGDLYKKIGVNRQQLGIGGLSGLDDESRPWNKEELARMDYLLEDIYDAFTLTVAEGRQMPQDEVKGLGGGRIWSGKQAVVRGLADRLGGLHEAVELARELSNEPNAKVLEFPLEMTLMALIQKFMSGELAIGTNSGPFPASMMTGNPAWLAAAGFVPPKVLNHLLFLTEALGQDSPRPLVLLPWMIETRTGRQP